MILLTVNLFSAYHYGVRLLLLPHKPSCWLWVFIWQVSHTKQCRLWEKGNLVKQESVSCGLITMFNKLLTHTKQCSLWEKGNLVKQEYVSCGLITMVNKLLTPSNLCIHFPLVYWSKPVTALTINIACE